jgi:hypothetical protein
VKEIVLSGDQSGIREMVMQNLDGDRTSTALDVVSNNYPFTAEQLEDLFVSGKLPVIETLR